MSNNSILINLINILDIKVTDKKVFGDIHKIEWVDLIKISHLIRQVLERLYPNLKVSCPDFLGENQDQIAAGIELSFYGEDIDLDDFSDIVNIVVHSVLSNQKCNNTRDLFIPEGLINRELPENIKPIIENFIETSTRSKIAVPVCIEIGSKKITVNGNYKKAKHDKVFHEHIRIDGQIDLLGKKTTKFTITSPNQKTFTVYYDPEYFNDLHEMQGRNEIANFEIQPIQENNKMDYVLKSINRVIQTLDACI